MIYFTGWLISSSSISKKIIFIFQKNHSFFSLHVFTIENILHTYFFLAKKHFFNIFYLFLLYRQFWLFWWRKLFFHWNFKRSFGTLVSFEENVELLFFIFLFRIIIVKIEVYKQYLQHKQLYKKNFLFNFKKWIFKNILIKLIFFIFNI